MRPFVPRSCFALLGPLTTACLLVLVAGPVCGSDESADADFLIRTWDRREGLPATVINQIQRAPNGYLWLATQKGLVRFDGERFSLFDTQNAPELRTNWVWGTLSDEHGALWV